MKGRNNMCSVSQLLAAWCQRSLEKKVAVIFTPAVEGSDVRVKDVNNFDFVHINKEEPSFTKVVCED